MSFACRPAPTAWCVARGRRLLQPRRHRPPSQAELVRSTDVSVNEYDGLLHEVLFEPEGGERVLGDIVAWMAERA